LPARLHALARFDSAEHAAQESTIELPGES
jgi:hypothetical protein